ncbi:CBS domain-containing protein [Archangium violaceum]|uniref:CBS domain-containing protein n=1 Tax=Archangium violaceum TaxID=83451 RepID=UPI00194DD50B|nr:CBS domain-containing protein [Archangium violaceum]QRO00468.1 CBS domain-containing protein [Archangium violaceum]
MRAALLTDLPTVSSLYEEETEPLPAPALCTVDEVMVRNVIAVHPDTSLRTATELMLEHAISGIPVVDEAGLLVGMLSKTDLVRHQLDEESADSVTLPSDQHVLEDTTVEDVMTRQVLTVPAGASLAEAAKVMAIAGVHRVPVVAPGGALTGLVTTSDLVRWVAGLP